LWSQFLIAHVADGFYLERMERESMRPPKSSKRPWRIWLDTGGTFTDGLAVSPSGDMARCKVLSSAALRGTVVKMLDPVRLLVAQQWRAPMDFIAGFTFALLEDNQAPVAVAGFDPATGILILEAPLTVDVQGGAAFEVRSPEEAPVLAARLLTQTRGSEPLPAMMMRLATTKATNALLEQQGAPVVLFITAGFGDLLSIGTQARPDIFALEIKKPQPLYQAVIEVDERVNAQGEVVRPLNLDRVKRDLDRLELSGDAVAAIALMHSYLNPQHEEALRAFLSQTDFVHISCSSDIAPFIKLLPRAETAVIDAYLSPLIRTYLERVKAAMSGGTLHVMTSAGGLVSAAGFLAKDSLLSGPAGGVVGAALAGRKSGFDKIIAFDMGGTSTDVSRYDGDYEYVFEHAVGDAHLVSPALAIESVAAGGGSICHFDGFRLRVGPRSAGAHPGPACYGASGPLTLTDVNLLLGRLDEQGFQIPISKEASTRAFEQHKQSIIAATGSIDSDEALLMGFLNIANELMADAIRKISVRKGMDPQEYTLVSFGGAGGQHACKVAELLGISTLLIPQDASLLSAFGLGHAVIERFAERQLLASVTELAGELPAILQELTLQSVAAVRAEGVPEGDIQVRRRIVNARFRGQDSVLSLEYDPGTPLEDVFEAAYTEMFGHLPERREIEIESLRVVCSTRPVDVKCAQSCPGGAAAKTTRFTKVYFEDGWQETPVFARQDLQPGDRLRGPALVIEEYSTVVVEHGWQAEVDEAAAIVLRKNAIG